MPVDPDQETLLDMISEEMVWPASDRPLLAWYLNRLGVNRVLTLWQEQSLRNETQPPRSKYRAFRARLSKAITPTP
jgi:hypothetical protein